MTTHSKIAIACDHAGFALKEQIKAQFKNIQWQDYGTNSQESCNYADYGHALGRALDAGEVTRGIIICGSGIGISIAANRHRAVRAALCTDATMARLARLHNDANVLALGARIIGTEVALDCIKAFLTTEFEGGRHKERVEKINSGI